jgi:23S rRNA (pseudouridine1915-N3)-methyltransferase
MIAQLVAVGHVRNPAIRSACEEYQGRIRRYLRLEVREVKDAGRRDRDAVAAREFESEVISKAVRRDTLVFALTRTGTRMSSTGFATRLDRLQLEGRDASFVIGGAHGLAQSVLDSSDIQLSLSAMTLPHELARLVLLEQLYRACTILKGEPYHKGG